MNRYIHTYMFFILLGFSAMLNSCQRDTANERLIREAQACYEAQPDSALALLRRINNPELLNNADYADWCMTYTRACDLTGTDLPFAMQLQRASDYYAKHGSVSEQIEILLYLGRACEDESNRNNAMQHYVAALDKAKKINDLPFCANILNRIAGLYRFSNYFDHACEAYQQAANYYLQSNDTLHYAYALRNIGLVYAYKDSFNTALDYCLQAYEIALPLGDSTQLSSLSNRIGVCYKGLGKYDLAEHYLLLSIAYEKRNSAPTYTALADLFMRKADYNKARDYLRQSSEATSENYLTKGGNFYHSYLIEKGDANYESALNALEQYETFADSLRKIQDSTNVLKVEKRFEHEQLLTNFYKLQSDHQQIRFFAVLAALAAAAAVILFQLRITRKNRKIREQQDTIRKEHEALIEKEIEMQGLQTSIGEVRQRTLYNMPIYQKIMRNAKSIDENKRHPLNDSDWIALQEAIQTALPGFDAKLNLKFPNLTNDDRRFCHLLKLGLDNQQLSILLDIHAESVNRKRTRILKRHNLDNKNLSLNALIAEL